MSVRQKAMQEKRKHNCICICGVLQVLCRVVHNLICAVHLASHCLLTMIDARCYLHISTWHTRAKLLWCLQCVFHIVGQSQHSLVQVDLVGRTPALEVASTGPQTPLELAASVATAAPGHHHPSSSSAPKQDTTGVPLLWHLLLHTLYCFMLIIMQEQQ